MTEETTNPIKGGDYFGVVMGENDRRLIRNPRISSALARAGRLAKKHGKKFYVLKVIRVIGPDTERKDRPEDQERRQSQSRAIQQMLRMPIGFQTQLEFETVKKPSKTVSRQKEIEYAKSKGYSAGWNDKPMKTDYEDQELVQAFNAAWHEGQEVLKKALEDQNEKDAATSVDDDALDDNAEADAAQKAQDDAEAAFT